MRNARYNFRLAFDALSLNESLRYVPFFESIISAWLLRTIIDVKLEKQKILRLILKDA